MPHINFLEKREWDWRQIQFNYLFIVVTSALFLFWMTAYGILQKYRLSAWQNRLTAVMTQMETLRKLGQDQPANKENSFLAFYKGDLLQWTPILSSIVSNTPPSVWLKSLSGSLETRRVDIEGGAGSPQAIARFEEALRGVELFRKVAVVASGLEEKGPNDSQNKKEHFFKMQCLLNK